MDLVNCINDMVNIFDETNGAKYMLVWDKDNDTIRWTRVLMEYLGVDEVYSNNARESIIKYIHPDDCAKFLAGVNKTLQGEEDSLHVNLRIRHRNGTYHNAIARGRKLIDSNVFVGNVLILDDADNRDVLTNLNTFTDFLNVVNDAIENNQDFIMMAIEIDHFHSVNSVYGFDFGNRLLFELGICFKSLLKGRGKAFRLEGTKFAFYLVGKDIEVARKLYGHIKALVHEFHLDGHVISIDINGGAIVSNEYHKDYQAYYSSLLVALERSKDARNGQLFVFDDDNSSGYMEDLQLIEKVKASIFTNCNGFYLCYQPLISAINGTVIGAEALLRWRSDEYGNVSPYRFIPYLESHPSFYQLGLWIIRKALSDALEIIKLKPNFFMNINISYAQLEHKRFKNDLMSIMDELKYPKANLQIELTERCKNLNIKFLKSELDYFKSYGIKIALDDFGTGSSGLELVGQLPLDSLKIDQGFVRDILNNKTSQVIVDTAVECAARLGIVTCLEGVEDENIREFTHNYAVNYHQGYFYSKPVEYNEFITLLDKQWINTKPRLINRNGGAMSTTSILSRMPGGFFIYSASDNERIVEINEAAIEMFGCETLDEFVELTGNSFKGIVHPEDYDRVQNEINEQINNSESEMDYVEYRIIRKDGEVRNIRDYGHLVHTDYNDDLYYVFINEIV